MPEPDLSTISGIVQAAQNLRRADGGPQELLAEQIVRAGKVRRGELPSRGDAPVPESPVIASPLAIIAAAKKRRGESLTATEEAALARANGGER